MIHHPEIVQNEDKWLQMRAGLVTMSKLNVVMANSIKKKDGKSVFNAKAAFGDPAKKYAIDLAVEQITKKPVKSSYSNATMDQGHILEPVAVAKYEQETFSEVKPGGFFCDDKIGYSPDGIQGNGLIEVKSSITTHAHYERIRKQSIDSSYRWQVIGGLKYTGKPWLDFVSYCEDFPEEKQLFILKVWPEMFRDEFKMIDERVSQFLELVKKTKTVILESRYL